FIELSFGTKGIYQPAHSRFTSRPSSRSRAEKKQTSDGQLVAFVGDSPTAAVLLKISFVWVDLIAC
ncbi:MAG: hypothetical protein ACI9JR_002841, partial [Gammaproteobacteria bacterium]